MDYRGSACTLHPVTWPPDLSPAITDSSAVNSFFSALLMTLRRAGLDPRMPVPGAPDLPLVVSMQVVRADPGSQFMRWAFTMLAGYAVFEVSGGVSGPLGTIGIIHASGTRRWAFMGGDSVELLRDAARMAGERAAAQVLTVLAAAN